MPSPETVDIAALLAPIPGEDPAGSAIPFPLRHQLDEGRKEDDPNSYAPDDPMRPKDFKKADWPGVIRAAQEALTRNSKDLLVAARLTEALAQQYRFAGLRDGLRLFRGLFDQCWDHLYPPLEDGDLEPRAGQLNWLDDPYFGARFPSTLRQLPLLVTKDVSYSLQQCDQSEANKAFRVPQEDLDKALRGTSRAQLTASNEDVAECLAELNLLRASLNARLKAHAPALLEVEKVLESCRQFLQHALEVCPDLGTETNNTSGGHAAADKPAATGASSPLASRAEAYRQLAQAAARLQELEPHSPIPYLIKRAVELGALPFPKLVKALIRDGNVLEELNREFGIKESDSETTS